MATPTLLIEGSFAELAEELASYIDNLDSSAGVLAAVQPQLTSLAEAESSEGAQPDAKATQPQKDDVLKKIITKAKPLINAPDREFTAAYNLLITLANGSPIKEQLFARLCGDLSNEVSESSSPNAPALVISVLQTIFNVLPVTSKARYHVFIHILNIIGDSSQTQIVEPLLAQVEQNLPSWLAAWDLSEEEAQELFVTLNTVTNETTGDSKTAFKFMLQALGTGSDMKEKAGLAREALRTALVHPTVFDFGPLLSLEAIQNLRQSDATLFELLEIFSADDYAAFKELTAKPAFKALNIPEKNTADMTKKIRLLTLSSLAASASNRSVPYSTIAEQLEVPQEEVEMWVIDTIKADLIEGKLSQLKQEFLVHRATHRVFGDKQWAEIQSRLMVWRNSLQSVLSTIRTEKERYAKEGVNGGDDRVNGYEGQPRRQNRRQQQPRETEVGAD